MKIYDEHSILATPRNIFTAEHEAFRTRFRAFVKTHIQPNYAQWEKRGVVHRSLYEIACKEGFYLRMNIPEQFGGQGLVEYQYNAIVAEELEHLDCGGIFFTLGNDMVLSYFTKSCTAEQQARWLPQIAQGKVLAVAMSEPEIGSDLAGAGATAVLRGDHYVLNGRKMWISTGKVADLVVVACYTDRAKKYRGMTLLVVQRGMPGFETAKTFKKLGKDTQDTCLLTFTDVKVPISNVVGHAGEGFKYLMQNLPKERLSIAVSAMGAARRALAMTVNYVHSREAFGRPISNFQSIQFKLAELRTEVQVGTVFVDHCIEALTAGTLTTETASMAKYMATELSFRVADACLQCFGGYGYVKASPIAKVFADQRVMRIYGGANEVMKEIIGKGLGFKPQRFSSKL
eukprot:CAMPEP_0175137638 /NCGR_PEP_ID=MMETSP0087-20121206/9920_1 /TAXON_ID=136419 /ORGANISM="Unknown Unknown, Strain D1" /LENGTH=400 /DNA_ID=CAMNT_0016420483 /DNA_START=23 /DNA_END=1225 /DNA_ORIENTATION=-